MHSHVYGPERKQWGRSHGTIALKRGDTRQHDARNVLIFMRIKRIKVVVMAISLLPPPPPPTRCYSNIRIEYQRETRWYYSIVAGIAIAAEHWISSLSFSRGSARARGNCRDECASKRCKDDALNVACGLQGIQIAAIYLRSTDGQNNCRSANKLEMQKCAGKIIVRQLYTELINSAFTFKPNLNIALCVTRNL